jgi:hypothetical protein
MPSYYNTVDQNALNIQYAFDLSIMSTMANLLFKGDLTRVIYRANDYCFRARTDANRGVLNMPFMNLQCVNWKYEDPFGWYTFPGDKLGMYVEELQSRVHMIPIKLEYEASVWFERDDDLKTALASLLWFRENHTQYSYNLTLKNQAGTTTATMADIGILNFEGLSISTEYNEKDWLDKNQIRGIAANFTVETFLLKTDYLVYPVDTVLFEFGTSYAGETVYADMTFEEKFNFVLDRTHHTIAPV